ncbi:MAG: 4Fe-4S binding protein [Epulopiscium sp.]|nr:4Fe-4S binding protein [Candidatus Epulonipiscium sp.]
MSDAVKKDKCIIEEHTPWQETTLGGVVTSSGNAQYYKTGGWRAMKPIWKEDQCKQCLLCWPTCPDSSIPIKDKKRQDFDYDHCKGCGVCAKVCPFNAIDFVVEGE